MSRIREQDLSLDELLAQTADPECGALVLFAGTVRLHNHGREVSHIEYSAYTPLADKTLAKIEQEACERFHVPHCRLLHRSGDLSIGEVSVYAVVRSVHRAEAFDAARYAVEALKHRVAIWKHEHYTDGSCAHMQGCSLVEPEQEPTE